MSRPIFPLGAILFSANTDLAESSTSGELLAQGSVAQKTPTSPTQPPPWPPIIAMPKQPIIATPVAKPGVDVLYSCSLCYGKYSSATSIQAHMSSKHRAAPKAYTSMPRPSSIPCDLCDWTGATPYSYARHMSGAHHISSCAPRPVAADVPSTPHARPDSAAAAAAAVPGSMEAEPEAVSSESSASSSPPPPSNKRRRTAEESLLDAEQDFLDDIERKVVWNNGLDEVTIKDSEKAIVVCVQGKLLKMSAPRARSLGKMLIEAADKN